MEDMVDKFTYLRERASSFLSEGFGGNMEFPDSELEVSKLKAEVKELQSLKVDAGKLVLRQMVTQVVNKVARISIPKSTPWDVRDIRMEDIPQLGDAAKYSQVMSRYPNFQKALHSLCDPGRPVAHPVPSPPVSEQQLQELIAEQLGKTLQAPALEALQCLVDLSKQLQEDLFVSTEKPKEGRKA